MIPYRDASRKLCHGNTIKNELFVSFHMLYKNVQCIGIGSWCSVCRAIIDLTKFTTPWLLYRLIWVPTTRNIFRSLMLDYQLSACRASSNLAYINLVSGCFLLLLTVLYNRQFPVDWIKCKLNCWSVHKQRYKTK